MSIKTLHVTNCFHSQSGGIATFYRELLKHAERHERPIRLIVPAPEDGVETHGRYGKIYRIASPPSRLSPGYRILMPWQYLRPRSFLRQIVAEEQPGLIECCDKYTLNYLAGLLRRGWLPVGNYRPALVGLSCERMDENVAYYLSSSQWVQSLCRHYMRWLYFPMFDHHIAVSGHSAGELYSVSQGHRIRRGVWVRPMGASCDLFRPERRNPIARRRLQVLAGAPESASLLLYVGRLAPEKNLGLLVDTMERLEHTNPGAFHLVVAGDGSQRAMLERECRERVPGAACCLGHIADRDALASLYANCDIFLHPNPREPFGIAPLEAMASGLALLGPNSGGITNYANSQNAWLVDADAESFAAGAWAIHSDPEGSAIRRRAARLTAERFDWSRIINGYFDLYDELHALVQGERSEPRMAPAFYSTARRGIKCEV